MREIFSTDTRGVSEVVGAVLLLGILILLLTSYQAVVVPNQNAATEFEHNQQVEDEFVDVRNAIIEARSGGRSTFASVKLGAQYQNRIFAINPPPPSGTVQTTQQANLSVTEDGSGDPLGLNERPLENNFVEYTPRYFEYGSAGTIRFENTVAYHDYGETNVLLTDQTLLRGNTVSLIPVEGTFRESGTRRVAIEPMPGVLDTVSVEDPEITVPTELSNSTWGQLLADELEAGDSLNVSNGNLILSLDGTYDVAYAPVGINRAPREGERPADSSEINPAAPGDVSLERVTTSQQTYTLTFNNTADTTNFTRARINFYNNDGGQAPTRAELFAANDPTVRANLAITGDFRDISPPLTIAGKDTTNMRLTFDGTGNMQGDWFVITIIFESGERGQYFVTRSA